MTRAHYRRSIAFALILAVVWLGQQWLASRPDHVDATAAAEQTGSAEVDRAFLGRLSNQQVTGSGTVVRILADDNDGSRHQRFIVRLESDRTVLIAHNIDLAPRVSGLRSGDEISFHGEYEWNQQGGVVHWTHHDPRGSHAGGWIRHRGATYR